MTSHLLQGMRQPGQREQVRAEKKQKRQEELVQKGADQSAAWKAKLNADLGIAIGGERKKIVMQPRT